MAQLCAFTQFGFSQKIQHPKKRVQGGKIVVSYNDVHRLVAAKAPAMQAEAKPDTILAIGGGGLIPGRILRTYLDLPLLSVSVSFYNDSTLETKAEPQVIQWLDDASVDNYIKGKNVLVVDDVDDTRSTLTKTIQLLGKLQPKTLSVFVLHGKNRDKIATMDDLRVSKYFVGEQVSDAWVEYPWDIKFDPRAKNTPRNTPSPT
eukprot:TRINITY_DN22071_c0_g1_i1.p1 TRINITY_DN22071_c0_g1~~TRINITY_DN22071_c0_g1_i1.p1  ORF type:complete len:203 (-),score=18.02 TRINITY_DN22071_c0_g1_i1:223-831(-)